MKISKDSGSTEQGMEIHPRLPDFLIIGAAKAGTTALFKAIGRHPHVYLPIDKEPRFFSFLDRSFDLAGPGAERLYRTSCKNTKDYMALFSECPESAVTGEASACYLECKRAPQKSHEWLPRAKLIAILRHPVDRAYSHFLNLRHDGKEPLADFKDAFMASDERAAARWIHWFHYKQKGFYGAHINRWLEYFPREQLLILFYEDWLERPGRVLNAIWNHLGIASIDEPLITKENVTSLKPRWVWLNQKMTDPENRLRLWAQHYLPLAIRDTITRQLLRMNLKPGPQLDPILRRELAGIYAEDLNIIEALTCRDLRIWLK